MSEVRIEGSFETLSQEEWDTYLGLSLFDGMLLCPEKLDVSKDGLPDLSKPKFAELIQEHNNKVGSLRITYALCKHYFDKGIPDNPWYASPGTEGQSVQYMPLFKTEHWMRHYWFNYFSDTYYLKLSSVWDSLIEILNYYYGLNYKIDMRLRSSVQRWLKDNVKPIQDIFDAVQTTQVYSDAQKYRTAAAHGTSPSSVSNTIQEQENVWTEVLDTDVNGKIKIDETGRAVMKRIKATKVISLSVGQYTFVADIMKNMEEYAIFSGEEIQKIVSLMIT
jgi:hypothetical protein